MDFENVYQSRFIIYKMLRLRGYDTLDTINKVKKNLIFYFKIIVKKLIQKLIH